MKTTEQHHHYITTVSGINIGDPTCGQVRPEHIRMLDIMCSLAKQCRYNGHVDRGFYSVAEHSVLVSRIAEELGDEEAMLPALLHDAHEAYMGDIARPQKAMMGRGVVDFESAMERAVRAALGLPGPSDPVWGRVADYDSWILHRELECLRIVIPDWWDPQISRLVPSNIRPLALPWQEAQSVFRHRLHDLGWGLGGTL